MSAGTKNRAIIFWSAYYLPLLQIFLFTLIDGIGFWSLLGSIIFVVAGMLFGTFHSIKDLPFASKLIAGAVFPASILAALWLKEFAEVNLVVGFIAFVILVIMAVASSMQMHSADSKDGSVARNDDRS
jgi:DMSO/TMAO reductase YedYZ heme-binding membrane subunit